VRVLATLAFCVLEILFSVQAEAQVAVPPLKAWVTDSANTLSPDQRGALEQTLREFEARKGSQIAVLIVPTTRPETAFDYGVRVYDQWKLGRKGVDDGVLLVIAKNDRDLWIVTGGGAEGPLPDAAAKRIVEEDIVPRFKQGDFYGGIRSGIDRIMRTIEGEPLPPPRHAGQQSPLFQHIDWLIPAFVILMIAQGIMKTLFGRALGAGLTGAVAGLLAWLVVGSLVLAVLVGAIAFVFGLFGGNALRYGGGSGGGGWSSGGGSWGGSSGGGFSGGGGGSTAGGGAGGSW
jgi:uncharacterized protein